MSVYILTIAGVERPLRLGSLSLNTVVNGRHVMSCAVLSENGVYRPTVAQEAQLTEDGTPIFGGIIRLVEEEGADGQPIADISSRITCDSFNVLAERRFVTATIPAGSTLKQALQILDDYLTDYGVTLDAGQVTGPTLDGEQNIYGEALNSVLDTLSQRTGYIWEIDASKTFRMFEPGTSACPIDVIVAEGVYTSTGDIQVSRSRDKYVNRVVIKGGKAVQVDKTDTFTGDGVEDTFPLTYPLVYSPTVGYGYVWNGDDPSNPGQPQYETLDLAGNGASWSYDPTTNSITRDAGAPANLNAISITYPAQFPIFVTVEDAAEIVANGIFEAVFEYPDVYDKPVLQEIGESLLSQGLEIKTELTIQTRSPGVMAGQSLTVTAADRAVDGEFLITEVNARTENSTSNLLRTLKCVEGSVFKGSFRGLIKAWLGGGSTAASTGPAPSAGGSSAHPPQRAVQVFKDGQFYGDGDHLSDYDGNGPLYGGFPSRVSIKARDEATANICLVGPDGSFVKSQTYNGGDFYMIGGGGAAGDWSFQPPRDFAISSGRKVTFDVGSKASDYIEARGLFTAHGLALGNTRTTSSTYAVDGSIGGGGTPLVTILADPSSGAITVSLPAVASALVNPSSSMYRMLCVKNIGTANTVTLDADGSEVLFDGFGSSTTLVLSPGQAVWMQARNGTGAGWYVLASHGRGGSVAGSDTQVQFNDAGSQAGNAALTFDKTTQQLKVAADTTSSQVVVANAGSDGDEGVVSINPRGNEYSDIVLSGQLDASGDYIPVDTVMPYLFANGATGEKSSGIEITHGETPGAASAFATAVGFKMGTPESTAKSGLDVYEYGGLGTGAVPGLRVSAGRNSSGSGAAGHLVLYDKSGTPYYLWVEAGKLRIHTAPPTEDNTTVSHTAGTVVGTQS